MEADVAAERLAKIKAAGIDKVRFAWAGETEKGKKHYYSIQGPTFLSSTTTRRTTATTFTRCGGTSTAISGGTYCAST